MRFFIMAIALVMSANVANAGRLTCWYDPDFINIGAEEGNLAGAEDGWEVVDTSDLEDARKTYALFMHWPDNHGALDESDCPATLYVRPGNIMPVEDRPQPH